MNVLQETFIRANLRLPKIRGTVGMLVARCPRLSLRLIRGEICRQYLRSIFGEQAGQGLLPTSETQPPRASIQFPARPEHLANIDILPQLSKIERTAPQLVGPEERPTRLHVDLGARFRCEGNGIGKYRSATLLDFLVVTLAELVSHGLNVRQRNLI